MSETVEGLAALGWDEERARETEGRAGTPGRVVRQDRGWVQVVTADGVVAARTRADRVGTPVVGDWVLLGDDEQADVEVAEVLERRSALRRADPVGEGEQVLAANLDAVLIVTGLDRPVKAGRIHRAAAQAWDAGARPTIVLTKADLVDDPDAVLAEVEAEHPGADVVAVSAHTGRGVRRRSRPAGRGRPSCCWASRAQASPACSTPWPAVEVAATGDVRDFDAKGRHTTTRRELHLLPGGGIVVDTPGIRAMGLYAEPRRRRRRVPRHRRPLGATAGSATAPTTTSRAARCSGRRRGRLRSPPSGSTPTGQLHAEAEWARRPTTSAAQATPLTVLLAVRLPTSSGVSQLSM